MPVIKSVFSLPFYLRYSWFQFRERFTNFGSSMALLLIFPFFIWLLTQMWGKFNSYQGHYSQEEVYIYISITELLFITFLRSPVIHRANADFSISLARPRSWLILTFFGQAGTTLGARLLYSAAAITVLHLLGLHSKSILIAYMRLSLFLPILTMIEAIMASILVSSQLLWHETKYFVLPITKIFLALGGVIGPLVDYGQSFKEILLKLPTSDLFFQVGHYCVKGEFYDISKPQWVIRISTWTLVFSIWNVVFHNLARRHHQSFGG